MKKRHVKYYGLSVLFGAILTSCSASSSYNGGYAIGETQRYYSGQQAEFLPSLSELPAQAFTSEQASYWWENFNDPLLNHFVARSLETSFDTRRALLNVEQAEAILRGVRADILPAVNLNTQALTQDLSSLGADAALNVNWNLDLFGKTRAQIKQAQSELANSQATAKDVNRLTLARITQAYIAYRTTQDRILLSEANLARLLDNQKNIRRLVDTGFSTKLDLNRTQTQVSQLQSRLASLQAQKVATRNALAIFVQIPPQKLQELLSSSVDHKLTLPQNLTPPQLDLLIRHRPDIRSAEWSLIAATQSQRAAQLALYPDVTLGGDILRLSTLTDLADIGNVSSALFANLAQPLLGRGRLLANIDLQSARVQQALVDYEETVLQAVLDIDTALSVWGRRQEQLAFDKSSLDTAIEAQQLAKRLFFAGESNFTALIVAENTRLAAEENYLLSRQAAFESYIAYAAATVPNW